MFRPLKRQATGMTKQNRYCRHIGEYFLDVRPVQGYLFDISGLPVNPFKLKIGSDIDNYISFFQNTQILIIFSFGLPICCQKVTHRDLHDTKVPIGELRPAHPLAHLSSKYSPP